MTIDFSLGESQRQLQDSARRYLTQGYAPAWKTSDGVAMSDRCTRAWAKFAELGWLALPLPEAYGGLGLGIVDVAVLMEEFGRALVTEPYVSTVVLSADLLAAAGNEAQRAHWLPRIAQGRAHLPFAHQGDVTAQPTSEGWVLSGCKSFVPVSGGTEVFLVSAWLSSAVHRAAGDETALGLFLVPADAPGLHALPVEVIDHREAVHLRLDATRVAREQQLAAMDDCAALEAVLEDVLARAYCAHLAEAVGCMDALLEATIDHTRTRQQFGRPLAANQVVRHRLVDMAVQCVEARSIVLGAVLRLAAREEQRHLTLAAAMHKVGRGARFVAEQAVQLHGAMGITEEIAVGAWLKRLLTIDAWLGLSRDAATRYALLATAACAVPVRPTEERPAA